MKHYCERNHVCREAGTGGVRKAWKGLAIAFIVLFGVSFLAMTLPWLIQACRRGGLFGFEGLYSGDYKKQVKPEDFEKWKKEEAAHKKDDSASVGTPQGGSPPPQGNMQARKGPTGTQLYFPVV